MVSAWAGGGIGKEAFAYQAERAAVNGGPPNSSHAL
jgi:hypothetical protein